MKQRSGIFQWCSIVAGMGLAALGCSAEADAPWDDTAQIENEPGTTLTEQVVTPPNLSSGYAVVSAAGSLTSFFNNSAGGVSVNKTGTGTYEVTMYNFNDGFNAQVVATSGSDRCALKGIVLGAPGPVGGVASVLCTSAGGTAKNVPFVLQVVRAQTATSNGWNGAYGATLVKKPSSGTSIPMNGTFNSSGGANNVTYLSTGRYKVVFPGISTSAANINVTASGWGAAGEHCKVQQWSSQQSPVQANVWVDCYAPNGNLADSAFSVAYRGASPMDAPLISGSGGWGTTSGNSVLNQQSPQCPGSPNPITISWGSGTSPIVTFPTLGDATKGVPLVTARGNNNIYCNIQSWSNGFLPSVLVSPRCFQANGTPVVANMQIMFSSTGAPPPC